MGQLSLAQEASIMVAMNQAVASGTDTSRGQYFWLLLCRAALQSVDWAAAVCSLKDTPNRVERSELLLGHGVTPALPDDPACQNVDWARLDDFERGRLSREMPRAGTDASASLTVVRGHTSSL